MKKILFFLSLILVKNCFATTYYVSTTGNDSYNGTSVASAFLTIPKAISKVVAGDIIYVRAGTYNITSKITVNKSGTASSRIYLLVYPGDSRPIIDGSAMATSSSNRGVDVTGSYWTIKGFDIYRAGDNGMHISGSNNIIEQCNFYENRDTGCQLSNGAANNKIINCDSYYNRDSTSNTNKDGNADGFAAKLDVGTGNSFKGCRAWQNSDDGWDGLLNVGIGYAPATTYDSCWCFMNGYLKSGFASIGNGNGFKVGGNNEEHDATLTRCLSAYNRVKGFDQNNDNGSMIFYNCTGYKNKPNFGLNNNDPNAGKVMIVKNCVSLSSGSSDVFRSVCVRTNNSWQSPVTTTTADFLAVDSIGLRSPRKADGSLPDINFMHLANGSDLINAGVDIGLPFNGSAPDIGCFESNYPVPVKFEDFDIRMIVEKGTYKIENGWTTATEINTSYFLIERSFDENASFEIVGKVIAKGASKYTYYDVLKTINRDITCLYYRIVAVDFDGQKTYSNVKKLILKQQLPINIFPNPVKNKAKVQVNSSNACITNIYVFDNLGKCVFKKEGVKLYSGENVIEVDLGSLTVGNYTLKLIDNYNIVDNVKIIKIR